MNEPQLNAGQAARQRSPVYSTFLPFLIVLVTLTLGSLKEIVTLLKCKASLHQEEVQATAYLDEARRHATFMDSLRQDLRKLSSSDSVAAQVLTDFTPPSSRKNGGPNSP